MIEFKYRPDVDGLRAVAVVLVLLFHAGLGFSGGFIGVDVFFVISGFLITGLINKELDANKFSLKEFWLRRVRRIIPAATVVVVATLIAGYLLLLPDEFLDLGASAIAQQLMLSNVYFWQNTGYFDGPADMKPLLHTWSLAVEEQFYLFYPFLLVFLHRWGHKFAFGCLLGIGFLSLAISEYGVNFHASAAFYLLPTRAWQMILGGLVCYLPQPVSLKPWVVSLVSWCALSGILIPSWLYTSNTPFPGLYALVPSAAAAALIYFNSVNLSQPAKLLASKGFVFVGLLSYSLYLWHWPILVYLKHWFGETISPQMGVCAISASFALAYLSWKYVETPLRKRREGVKPSTVFATAIGSGLVLIFVSFWIYSQDGVPQRFPENARNAAARRPRKVPTPQVTLSEIKNLAIPSLGEPDSGNRQLDFLVWGDSHALALTAELDSLAKKHGLHGKICARPATIPCLDVWAPAKDDLIRDSRAYDWNDAVIQFIEEKKIKHVILVARWAVYLEGENENKLTAELATRDSEVLDVEKSPESFSIGFRRTLDRLKDLNVNAFVLKQVPLQKSNPNLEIVRSLSFGYAFPHGVSLEEHQQRQFRANQIIDRHASGRENIQVIDLSKPFFKSGQHSQLGNDQGSFYQDDDHVSDLGAEVLLRPIIEEIMVQISEDHP